MMQTMNRIKQHRIAGRGNEKLSFNFKLKYLRVHLAYRFELIMVFL